MFFFPQPCQYHFISDSEFIMQCVSEWSEMPKSYIYLCKERAPTSKTCPLVTFKEVLFTVFRTCVDLTVNQKLPNLLFKRRSLFFYLFNALYIPLFYSGIWPISFSSLRCYSKTEVKFKTVGQKKQPTEPTGRKNKPNVHQIMTIFSF